MALFKLTLQWMAKNGDQEQASATVQNSKRQSVFYQAVKAGVNFWQNADTTDHGSPF